MDTTTTTTTKTTNNDAASPRWRWRDVVALRRRTAACYAILPSYQ
jgi:hypothetical protein